MPHFFDLTPDSLEQFCVQRDMPNFVAAQLLDWVYRKGVDEPEQMTNISARNREVLREQMTFYSGRIVRHQIATDGTQKLLVDWSEWESTTGNRQSTSLPLPLMLSNDFGDPNKQTECVMIPTEQRRTACISSQVGCPVGCGFCASGIGGLDGNLRAGQIVEQVHRLAQLATGAPQAPSPNPQASSRITNVVFMGMGEPLANFANVTNAIRTLNAPWGGGISARKITVSTVGLPAAIRKLVDFEIPVTLALSLHAPNDEIRRQLIPWANYATIEELLDACDEYFQRTGREITLEYLLLRNVNDRIEHAKELASLAKRLRANVNLIRYNEVKGLPFDRPRTQDVLAFQDVLKRNHVNAHVRASRGRDIAAACGQLRHEHRDTKPTAA
jgi:23S rRNA (adenine2503-C2)-methyltransferase